MNPKFQVWTREGRREISEVECWNQNGQLHRVDGPAWVTQNGTKLWYQNGLRHRVDGPAVVYPDGTQYWCLNGQLHRVDGPAVIFTNGTKLWFLNDQRLPKDEVESWINTNGIDLSRSQDQLIFLTKWGSR